MLMFLKVASYAHQGCDYFIKKDTSNIVKYYQLPVLSILIYLEYLLSNLLLWLQSYTPVLSVTWCFRNLSNVLIGPQEAFLINIS